MKKTSEGSIISDFPVAQKQTGFKCPNCQTETYFEYIDGFVRVACFCSYATFQRSEGEAIDSFYALWPVEHITLKCEVTDDLRL
jgi:hypothetical protein